MVDGTRTTGSRGCRLVVTGRDFRRMENRRDAFPVFVALRSALVDGTAHALHAAEYGRANILLSLALRAEMLREELALDAEIQSTREAWMAEPLLAQVLQLWNDSATEEQRTISAVAKLARRPFAFTVAGEQQPFAGWPRPCVEDVDHLLSATFFQRDVTRVKQEAADGKGLLLPELVGTSTCDLVAALVQLLLCSPFSPGGFAADMLGAFVDALRSASATPLGAPLDWTAVAALSEADLRNALQDGLEDDFFYEVEATAADSWRSSRAARLCATLKALLPASGVSPGDGTIALSGLRAMGTWDALRALLNIPCVTLSMASTLLLFELQRPTFPVCINALLELRQAGWVPPQAGHLATFLHLQARLPSDPLLLRTLYSCLCAQHAFRITRQAVVGNRKDGDDKPSPEEVAHRDRRAAYVLTLPVRTMRDDDTQGLSVVTAAAEYPGTGSPELPLETVAREHLHHHELYPSAGCTPLLVALRPCDSHSAPRLAAALASVSLPEQGAPGDGWGLRYVLDVPWSPLEVLTAVQLVGSGTPEQLTTSLRRLVQDSHLQGAGGSLLFGYGAQLDSGLHLAAKANRTVGVQALLESLGNRALLLKDSKGRSALHSACASAAGGTCAALIEAGADAHAVDDDGATPLTLAAAAGSITCCRALLEAGACASPVPSKAGSPLERAAGAGAIDVCRLLLQSHAEPNGRSASGKTALHAAARAGHLSLCRLLVDSGCDAGLADRTDRLAYEHLPPGCDGAWLLAACKNARKRQPRSQCPVTSV